MFVRTRPVSRCRSGGEPHRSTSRTVSPTCTRAPLADAHGFVHLLAVYVRSVARPEVFDPEVAVAVERAGVHLRHERVERERDVATTAAPERDFTVDGEGGTGFGRGFEQHEPPRFAAAGSRGHGGGLRHNRRGCRRRRAADLARDDPDDPREEQVKNREQAELQEREYGLRHRPLRLLVADGGFTDADHVTIGQRVFLDLGAVQHGAVHRVQVDDLEALLGPPDLGVVTGHL